MIDALAAPKVDHCGSPPPLFSFWISLWIRYYIFVFSIHGHHSAFWHIVLSLAGGSPFVLVSVFFDIATTCSLVASLLSGMMRCLWLFSCIYFLSLIRNQVFSEPRRRLQFGAKDAPCHQLSLPFHWSELGNALFFEREES